MHYNITLHLTFNWKCNSNIMPGHNPFLFFFVVVVVVVLFVCLFV